ncbi:MAG: O-antigen ligase family protein [Gammaproteobacteria bacterium]|nr:O-antigen ligase family protein [Gammaproteobacteria bacterium]
MAQSSMLSRLKWFVITVLAGMLVAFVAYHLWSLKTQHIVVIVVAVVLASFSMMFLRRYSDFLLVGLLCSIPLAAFTKSFFFNSWDHDARAKGVMRFSGVVSVALPDIILLGLYFLWAFNIAVMRTSKFPRLHRYDVLPLLLIAAYIFSIPGSPEPKAAVFGLYFLTHHFLIYFYLSRHIELRHFPWIVIVFLFTILPEAVLGMFQYVSGKWLTLAWSRGVGESSQYVVPGIEHIKRAVGTTFDSHSFGIYMAMLAPFPLVVAFARSTRPQYRVLWGGVFVIAMVAVVLSFSRSAWLSAAISLTLIWAVHLMWGQREVLPPTMLLMLLMLILSPWWVPLIIERFVSAGPELLTSRFDQFPVAWAIWKDHFFFGYGVGNYMEALHDYNKPGVIELPVHNVFLWVAAETGLFGVITFFGVIFAALMRLWRIIRRHSEPTSVLALAVFGALIAYLLDGLTDPLFREPVVYMMYWVCIAMSVAISRIDERLQELPKAPPNSPR